MSIINSFLITVFIPKDSTDTHILKRISELKGKQDVLLLQYSSNDIMDKEIENLKKTKKVTICKIFRESNSPLNFDYDIWKYMKSNFNHDYLMFIKSTALTLPEEIIYSDTLPNLILSRMGETFLDFFVSSANLFNSYIPDKEYPFNMFLTKAHEKIKPSLINPLIMTDTNGFPLWLYIEITTNCNLNCSYCKRDPEPKFMSVDQFNSILDKFPMVKGVNIIGLGEPLTHPKFKEILKVVEDRDLMLTFTTNGTIFKKDIYENLPSRTNLYVSLDGVRTDGVYASKTRKIDPTIIMNNLVKIRELRPNLNITLQCVVVKGFVNEVLDLIEFAKSINAEIHPTVPVLSTNELFDELFTDERETESVQLLLNSYNRSHKHLSAKPKFNMCNDVMFLYLILINGDVYPCCYLNTIRTQMVECYKGHTLNVDTNQYKLGNIFTDSPTDILNSIKLNKIRKSVAYCDPDDFETRDTINLTDATNYCKVCLARWQKGC